jgi:hypothetical protein
MERSLSSSLPGPGQSVEPAKNGSRHPVPWVGAEKRAFGVDLAWAVDTVWRPLLVSFLVCYSSRRRREEEARGSTVRSAGWGMTEAEANGGALLGRMLGPYGAPFRRISLCLPLGAVSRCLAPILN